MTSSLSYFFLIFFLILTSCLSKDNANANGTPSDASTDGSPIGLPAPSWTQTEYIFQNKTEGQISIIEPGWKVVLNAGECVHIEHLPISLDLTKFIKAGEGQLCGDSYRDCSNKLEASRTAGDYSDFERDKKSQESYWEIYNIVDSNNLFETVGSPFADPSQKNPWLERCKSPSEENNNPPEEKSGE